MRLLSIASLAAAGLALLVGSAARAEPAGRELRNGQSGLCLDLPGSDGHKGLVSMPWDCDGGADQRWTLNARGELRNGASDLCLEAQGEGGDKGRAVGTWTCNGARDQAWNVVDRGGGRFELRNRARGLCLDVPGFDGAKGAKLALWSCDGGADQTWSWQENVPEALFLVSAADPVCLDVDDEGEGEATVQAKGCRERDDQRWSYRTDGTLVNKRSGLCLAAEGGGRGAGRGGGRARDVAVAGCSGDPAQRWELVESDGSVSVRTASGRGRCLELGEREEGRRGQDVRLARCEDIGTQLWSFRRDPPERQAWNPPAPTPAPMPAPAPPPAAPEAAMTTFVNGVQGFCLDVDGTDGAKGSGATLSTCDGLRDQQWTLDRRGQLVNGASGACLEAADRDGAKGRNVGVWDCTGESDQLWDFAAAPGGRYVLRNRAQGMCLDAPGAVGNRGDRLSLWTCDGGNDQTWTMGRGASVVEYRPQPQPARPVPIIPDPPAPPRPVPSYPREMNGEVFAKVLAGMERASFPADKVEAFEVGTNGQMLTCAQLARAVAALSFPRDQVRIVELAAARVVDRQNREDVVARFAFPRDQNAVRRLLQ